jgi:hypothetical protein
VSLAAKAISFGDRDLWCFAQTTTGAEELEISETLDAHLPADDPRRAHLLD